MRTKAEILRELDHNTHTLWTVEFLNQANEAFETVIAPRKYEADGHINPKGLTLNSGAKSALGISSWELAIALCDQLGVPYTPKMGRGFQVRACTEALRNAGHAE